MKIYHTLLKLSIQSDPEYSNTVRKEIRKIRAEINELRIENNKNYQQN